MNILFLDSETSGTKFGHNALLEVGAILFTEGKQVSQYHFRQGVMEGKKVDLAALKYNGLRVKDLANVEPLKVKLENGEEVPAALAGFVDYLLDLPKNTVLCGHNVAFDVEFLRAELSNYGMENLGGALPYNTLDTKGISNFLMQAGILNITKNSLHNIADGLGISYEKGSLHGAMYDAQLTAEVYYGMLELTKELVPGDSVKV